MGDQALNPTLAIVENSRPDLCASPGQFFLAIPPTLDPYLPQMIFPFRIRGQVVESFIAPRRVQNWAQQGMLRVRGSFGRGFTLPAESRRALVLATDAAAGGILIPLVDSLVARSCEVTLICGSEELNENWLPPEVEFHVEEDILGASSQFWGWADTVFAAGHSRFYDNLASTVKERGPRLENGWGQVILYDLATPCGIGVCYLCALKTRLGFVLNCRDGPVYDLADLLTVP